MVRVSGRDHVSWTGHVEDCAGKVIFCEDHYFIRG